MRIVRGQGGFTMIELLVAMTVFSFMLMIITIGFLNVVRLHNQAIASNVAQDNARTAIDELVRAVRDSTGAVTPIVTDANGNSLLCLNDASGTQKLYYVVVTASPVSRTLYRADNCATKLNPVAITNSSVVVSNFVAAVKTAGIDIVKPEIDMSVTVGSSNGTTTGSGASISCGPSNADREFCATVTLTSGAVPR
jgi:prepilin-type N-terminal cleavage/methylation domain-containing protein